MAQISRTTSGMWPINVSWLQTRITNLKAAITSGSDITAANWNELVSIYNYWILHQHYSSDLRGVDTYGNLAVYGAGTYAATAYSSTPSGKTSSSDTVAATNEITTTKVNNLITKINSIRSHTHTIFDTTS